MRNLLKTGLLAAGILALTSAGAEAQNSTSANIGLSATISSFDNISCTQTSGGISFGSSITASGATAAQAVNCSVTSNDSSAVNVTAYLPTAAPLTGGTTSATIPSTDISWSATSGGTYVPFAVLSGSYSADTGAVVATGVSQGTNTAVNFYLELNVPASQVPDTYTATMTVAITPTA
jgi:hypothetical protein